MRDVCRLRAVLIEMRCAMPDLQLAIACGFTASYYSRTANIRALSRGYRVVASRIECENETAPAAATLHDAAAACIASPQLIPMILRDP